MSTTYLTGNTCRDCQRSICDQATHCCACRNRHWWNQARIGQRRFGRKSQQAELARPFEAWVEEVEWA